MENQAVRIKTHHGENLHNLLNIIALTIMISGLLNKSFGIGVGICLLLWSIINNSPSKIGEFTIDREKDSFSFPSIFRYSLWKSIVGLFFPPFQTTAQMETPISTMRRLNHYKFWRFVYIELYFNDGITVQTLRLPDKEQANAIISGLKEAKPDLYCDEFDGVGRLVHIRFVRVLLMLVCILLTTGMISPIKWICDEIRIYTLKSSSGVIALKTMIELHATDSDWKLDSVTDVAKKGNGYLVFLRYKNDSRTEDVMIETDSISIAQLSFSGPDYQRFLIKKTFENAFRKSMKEDFPGWTFEDIQVVHLKSNQYLAFITISKQGTTKEIQADIEDHGGKISWSFKPFFPF